MIKIVQTKIYGIFLQNLIYRFMQIIKEKIVNPFNFILKII